MSWAVVVFFVVVSPLLIGVSPSLPVDYVSHIIGFQVGARQSDPSSLAISPALYSIWTLPLLFHNGQHGMDRMWYPRSADVFGSITYGQASEVLTVAFLLVVGTLLVLRRSDHSLSRQLPLVALGMLGWLMVGDSLISRYLLYGLVLIILCVNSYRSTQYLLSVAWLTFVVFVTSWSHLSIDVPVFVPINPANSAITRALLQLFIDDRFITFGAIANLLVLVFLSIAALKKDPPYAAPVEQLYARHDPGPPDLRTAGEPVAS
jgi:hypothetical protein